jgi:hypothetical protein
LHETAFGHVGIPRIDRRQPIARHDLDNQLGAQDSEGPGWKISPMFGSRGDRGSCTPSLGVEVMTAAVFSTIELEATLATTWTAGTFRD